LIAGGVVLTIVTTVSLWTGVSLDRTSVMATLLVAQLGTHALTTSACSMRT
jgi:hypothetical protein